MAEIEYPLMTDDLDCYQYMRTGRCVYGSRCKFNHPMDRTEGLRASMTLKVNNSAYRVECKYYLLPGGCRYGDACKFVHDREKLDQCQLRDYHENNEAGETGLISVARFSAQMEEKECPFYALNGFCKYLAICRFRHPASVAVATQGFLSGYQNAESPKYPESVTSQVSKSSGHTLQISDESDSCSDSSEAYMPATYFHPQVLTSYDGHQGPIRFNYPSNFSAAAYASNINPTDPTAARSSSADERNVNLPLASPSTVPQEAHMEQRCQRSNQRPQPIICVTAASAENLSPTGLPLRPDRPICKYYSQFGLCKNGPACQFDHPSDDISSASAAA